MVRWWGIKGLKERRALDEPALYCSMLGAMEQLNILSGYQLTTAFQPKGEEKGGPEATLVDAF